MTQGKSIEHAFMRPGTKSSDLSWSGTDRSVLLHVFLLGFLVEETPSEHGENMQTPHRKAREIAHMSTVHSGEDLRPRATSAPCGNRTHDLLAVRRQCKQCKQLSHVSHYIYMCMFSLLMVALYHQIYIYIYMTCQFSMYLGVLGFAVGTLGLFSAAAAAAVVRVWSVSVSVCVCVW